MCLRTLSFNIYCLLEFRVTLLKDHSGVLCVLINMSELTSNFFLSVRVNLQPVNLRRSVSVTNVLCRLKDLHPLIDTNYCLLFLFTGFY